MRLDVYLTDSNIFESRKKATDNIKEGCISVDGKIITKPAYFVDGLEKIEVIGNFCPYVGRGGFKLEGALDFFKIDVNGLTCVDIGSSTGGFTDCLLQRGAARVYAVDSGRDQLHSKLREDSKVVCMEEFNARQLTVDNLGGEVDLAVMDVSFISQTHLYQAVSSVLKDNGFFISLVKPQFEAGKSHIGKNGIVKNEKIHRIVCENIKDVARIYGLQCIEIIESPIKGGDGNKEFLALFKLKK
ncbi:MAG: TlyA family RNA methyltransferase [Clostridia bacterium]|nr:TlyA family RNA methyltransferase [Clostridia bacterium]